MGAVIELRGLSKWYGEVIGLNNVTASVSSGITGLLGENGAGKTTLLSLVTGQLRPSGGEIAVFGERPWNNAALLSRVGYCPEGDSFWRGLTGEGFVRFLARLSGMDARHADRAADRALELVGMTEHQGRRVAGYSRGMRQRTKIAQALVHDPDLLILDEPLAGTDPVGRSELIDLLKRLADAGRTVLVSSHVLHEIEAMTENILLIDHGQLVAEGNVREIRALLEGRRHRIVVRTPDARRLAALLAPREHVVSLAVEEDGGLLLHTSDPERLLDELPRVLVDNDIPCSEVASPEDNLQAVFGYLTRRLQ
ncbi:MAG: ABC transporter ATP-binding protein [Planctomycetota bacterium]